MMEQEDWQRIIRVVIMMVISVSLVLLSSTLFWILGGMK